MALLIKNGDVVTAEDRFHADVLCEGERVTRIGRDLAAPPGAEVIDAAGKYVFPGFIDPHTHVYLPVMGTLARDTYETASRAALVGGTTCLFDFCIPDRGEDPLHALATWNEQSRGRSCCDYAYHLAVTGYDARIEDQVREIVGAHGIASFKVFLAYGDTVGLTDTELFQALTLAKELGVITAAHCENSEVIAALQGRYLAEGKTGPEWHYHTRPPIVEAEGTGHLMTFAELTGAHVYVVHLSCEEALAEALRGRSRGVKVWVETLIQFLLLDKTFAERPAFEGAKYLMSPCLKEKRHQDILWQALADRTIATLATDHAPFDFHGQKDAGREDFTRIPNGIGAIEDRVNLLYTHGVAAGRLDLQTFVDCASTQAARIFGLYPRKGTVEVGSDADLVVYDPAYQGVISASTQQSNLDYSAFEGWTIRGRPHVVTLRGEVAVREGRFVGTPGRGRFVPREPSHF
jgi:dihydropyrimidinase